MTEEKISTVIVTYNRLNLLLQCIAAVRDQTVPPHEIVIVDNASTDGTAEAIKRLAREDKRLTHLRLAENVGGAGGFHEGMRYISGLGNGWLWLMDDDAAPEQTALAELVAQADKAFDIYGSVAIDERQGSNLLCWPISLQGGTRKDKRIIDWESLPPAAKVRNLPFLGFFIHTSLMAKIGLPEKDFFISGDDTEYCLRACHAGSTLRAVGASRIRHPLPDRRDIHLLFTTVPVLTLAAWKRYYDTRNRLLIARKHFGLKLWTHTLPGTLVRWLVSLLVQQERRQQSRAFIDGISDGLLGRSGKRRPPGK